MKGIWILNFEDEEEVPETNFYKSLEGIGYIGPFTTVKKAKIIMNKLVKKYKGTHNSFWVEENGIEVVKSKEA
jgi:hypothetical protein